jgi:hypothetical protein
MYIPDLSQAFVEGRKVKHGQGEAVMTIKPVGTLVMPTGRIVACDPLVSPEYEPFTLGVAPGRYPVLLSVAQLGTDQRVAYAMLRFAERDAARWEMALIPGQDVSQLAADHFFGYPVDAGTGCFIDAEAARVLLERLKDEEYSERLIEEMDKNYVPTWSWLDECLDAATGANLIAFSSGWGDGAYASYFGYDEDGKVVNLITDFGVLFEDDNVEGSKSV